MKKIILLALAMIALKSNAQISSSSYGANEPVIVNGAIQATSFNRIGFAQPNNAPYGQSGIHANADCYAPNVGSMYSNMSTSTNSYANGEPSPNGTSYNKTVWFYFEVPDFTTIYANHPNDTPFMIRLHTVNDFANNKSAIAVYRYNNGGTYTPQTSLSSFYTQLGSPIVSNSISTSLVGSMIQNKVIPFGNNEILSTYQYNSYPYDVTNHRATLTSNKYLKNGMIQMVKPLPGLYFVQLCINSDPCFSENNDATITFQAEINPNLTVNVNGNIRTVNKAVNFNVTNLLGTREGFIISKLDTPFGNTVLPQLVKSSPISSSNQFSIYSTTNRIQQFCIKGGYGGTFALGFLNNPIDVSGNYYINKLNRFTNFYLFPTTNFANLSTGGFTHEYVSRSVDYFPTTNGSYKIATTSPTNNVSLQSNVSNVSAYPNPSNGNFSLDIEEKMTGTVSDINGKLIENIELNKSIVTKDINLDHLSNGTYFITINNGVNKITKTVVVEK